MGPLVAWVPGGRTRCPPPRDGPAQSIVRHCSFIVGYHSGEKNSSLKKIELERGGVR